MINIMTTPRIEEMVEELETIEGMTTPCIEELVEEFEEKIANKDFETWQLGKDWLRQALTQAHQAGIDEAVEILKKKKEETPEDSPYRRNQFMKPHSSDTLTTAFRKGFHQALDDTIKSLQDNK